MSVAPKREDYDVVVIGAGPAGLAAAATSAEAGLSTLLLDENIGPGGQVFRAISSTPGIRAGWRPASIGDHENSPHRFGCHA